MTDRDAAQPPTSEATSQPSPAPSKDAAALAGRLNAICEGVCDGDTLYKVTDRDGSRRITFGDLRTAARLLLSLPDPTQDERETLARIIDRKLCDESFERSDTYTVADAILALGFRLVGERTEPEYHICAGFAFPVCATCFAPLDEPEPAADDQRRAAAREASPLPGRRCDDCGQTHTLVTWPPECDDCGVTLWGRDGSERWDYSVDGRCLHRCARCHAKADNAAQDAPESAAPSARVASRTDARTDGCLCEHAIAQPGDGTTIHDARCPKSARTSENEEER